MLTEKFTDSAYAGALSGCLTRALAQPLDVVKIRQQLQVEPIKWAPNSQYCSTLQTITKIYQEEGLKSLWKGHVSGQMLSIIFGATQFATYEFVSNWNCVSNRNLFAASFFSGAVSGTVATLASFPFDVIRTRMVAQYETRRLYKGIVHGMYAAGKLEGVTAYYRGLLPAIIQISPYAGSQFMFYKFLQRIFRTNSNDNSPKWLYNYSTGCIAGILAKITVHPLDVVKKRLQIQHFEYKTRPGDGKYFYCTNMWDAIKKIWIFEKFPGFFKGLRPNLLKAAITTGLYFSFYETFFSIIKIVRQN